MCPRSLLKEFLLALKEPLAVTAIEVAREDKDDPRTFTRILQMLTRTVSYEFGCARPLNSSTPIEQQHGQCSTGNAAIPHRTHIWVRWRGLMSGLRGFVRATLTLVLRIRFEEGLPQAMRAVRLARRPPTRCAALVAISRSVTVCNGSVCRSQPCRYISNRRLWRWRLRTRH